MPTETIFVSSVINWSHQPGRRYDMNLRKFYETHIRFPETNTFEKVCNFIIDFYQRYSAAPTDRVVFSSLKMLQPRGPEDEEFKENELFFNELLKAKPAFCHQKDCLARRREYYSPIRQPA